MVVRVPELLAHVLRNPKSYPGLHNVSQERTTKGCQKLDPQRQLKLIWDAIIVRLNELLNEGKSVSINKLGTFSFVSVLHEQRYGADKVSKKPAFIPSNELKYACPNYHCKEELNVSPDALTAAQSVPSKVMFLNEVPIAAGSYYHPDVVRSATRQIFSAVVDLAERGYDLQLDMGCTRIRVQNKSVQASFSSSLGAHHAEPIPVGSFHSGARTANSETGLPRLSDTWKKAEFSESMANFLPEPKVDEVHATRVAVANLNVMSRDLTTCQ